MEFFRGSWAVLKKDLRLEWRSRYALNMLLMFVLSSLLLIAFAIGQETVGQRMQSALLWIVILFSASIGLGRSFVAEEERGTVLLLQLNVPGSQVFTGKLIFNFLLLLAVDAVSLVVFAVLLNMVIEDWGLLVLALGLGSLGLAGATTLLAAIIARASNKGPLLPVLLFPLLIPLLLSVVRASRAALDGGLGFTGATGDLQTIALFGGVVITAAVLLFDYVWMD
ncbi:MAG: heme exporter protein CcmB [Bacteroidetes bacterium]|nr:heme exporter protein CcmB [Bacteroidota bacterium]